jgi:hypothetical protein
MMEDFKVVNSRVWSLQTGEWLTLICKFKEQAFRLRCSGTVSKPPYAAFTGNCICGER